MFFFLGGGHLARNAPPPSSAASLGMASMCSCTIGMTVMAPAFVVGGLVPKLEVIRSGPIIPAAVRPHHPRLVGRWEKMGRNELGSFLELLKLETT